MVLNVDFMMKNKWIPPDKPIKYFIGFDPISSPTHYIVFEKTETGFKWKSKSF